MNTFVPPRSSPALVGDCCNTAELPLNRNPSSQWPGDPNDGGDDVDNDGDGDGGVPMMMVMVGPPWWWIQTTNQLRAVAHGRQKCVGARDKSGGRNISEEKKTGRSNPSIESSSASKQSPHSWLLLVIPIASYWPSSEYIGIDNGIGRSVVIWSLILLVLWYYQIWSSVLLYLSIVHLFVHHWTCDAASTW